jgi:hypothetical protein
MTKEQLESILVKLHAIKVPIGKFERQFLYFKKYPKQKESFNSSNKSLYQLINSQQQAPQSEL